MATQFPTGFNVTANEPIDVRLTLTKAQMKTAHVDFAMPDKYFCLCADDHQIYSFDIENPLDPEIGHFIVADSEVQKALAAEIERAKAEEARIDQKLDDEINRSTAEDERIDQKLDNEIARAEAAETQLQNDLAAEESERKAEDLAIRNDLDQHKADSSRRFANAEKALTEHDDRIKHYEDSIYVYDGDKDAFVEDFYAGSKLKNGNYANDNSRSFVLSGIGDEYVKDRIKLSAGQHKIIYEDGTGLASFEIPAEGQYDISYKIDGYEDGSKVKFALSENDPVILAEAAEDSVTTIDFGTQRYSNSVVVSKESFSVSGQIAIDSVSATNAYAPAYGSDYALRISSSSNAGSVTFRLDKVYEVESIEIVAMKYDDGAALTLVVGGSSYPLSLTLGEDQPETILTPIVSGTQVSEFTLQGAGNKSRVSVCSIKITTASGSEAPEGENGYFLLGAGEAKKMTVVQGGARLFGIFIPAGSSLSVLKRYGDDETAYPVDGEIANGRFANVELDEASGKVTVSDSTFAPYYVDEISNGFYAVVHAGDMLLLDKDGVARYSLSESGDRQEYNFEKEIESNKQASNEADEALRQSLEAEKAERVQADADEAATRESADAEIKRTYLPLAGGTMSGALDMGTSPFVSGGHVEVKAGGDLLVNGIAVLNGQTNISGTGTLEVSKQANFSAPLEAIEVATDLIKPKSAGNITIDEGKLDVSRTGLVAGGNKITADRIVATKIEGYSGPLAITIDGDHAFQVGGDLPDFATEGYADKKMPAGVLVSAPYLLSAVSYQSGVDREWSTDTFLPKLSSQEAGDFAYISSGTDQNGLMKISQAADPSTIARRWDSGNVDVALSPTEDQHAASKKYVDDSVSAEKTARTEADATLQSNIDAANAKIGELTAGNQEQHEAFDSRISTLETASKDHESRLATIEGSERVYSGSLDDFVAALKAGGSLQNGNYVSGGGESAEPWRAVVQSGKAVVLTADGTIRHWTDAEGAWREENDYVEFVDLA